MAPLTIGGLEIPWTKSVPPEDTSGMVPYNKQTRRTDILPKGWKQSKEKRAISCDIIYDQNIEIILRDGVKIYCDELRPVTSDKVPAIISSSPYGKGGHGFLIYENCPFRLGIPENTLSGLEKFEGVDPAEWIPRGYAVVNVNIRGSWESEGNIYIEGSQMGIDAYDVIEFVASRDWCSGSVSMAGNSWLATTQWTAAIQKPPSLKCIAPWEGFTDMYRDAACRGGIPKKDFIAFVLNKTVRGRQMREDIAKALDQWPLMNEYWEDKSLDTSLIDIPIYALGSYSSSIHGAGTIRGFNAAKSENKWLRIHSTHEWFDLYSRESTDDLQKFFDRYLKGIDNGWEKTPPVRVDVLTYGSRFGPKPLHNVPFTEYPPNKTNHRKLFLTLSNKLVSAAAEAGSGVVSYQSDDLSAAPADFTHVFERSTTLIGYSKAKLWMSCKENDDLDIFLSLRKMDADGKLLEHINAPWEALPHGINTQDDVPSTNTIKHLGVTGVLRASHREKDIKQSTDVIPWHPHMMEQRVTPGTVVLVEIGLWPMGIHFEAGEGLVLRIQGFLHQLNELPGLIEGRPENRNKGKHNIHIGGAYDSHLVIPDVPM